MAVVDNDALVELEQLTRDLGVARMRTSTATLEVKNGTTTVGTVDVPTGTPRLVAEDFTNGLWRMYDIARRTFGLGNPLDLRQ